MHVSPLPDVPLASLRLLISTTFSVTKQINPSTAFARFIKISPSNIYDAKPFSLNESTPTVKLKMFPVIFPDQRKKYKRFLFIHKTQQQQTASNRPCRWTTTTVLANNANMCRYILLFQRLHWKLCLFSVNRVMWMVYYEKHSLWDVKYIFERVYAKNSNHRLIVLSRPIS